METGCRKKYDKRATPFKSYYVVWKLFRPEKIHPRPTVFKSYYVVWKPLHVFTPDSDCLV